MSGRTEPLAKTGALGKGRKQWVRTSPRRRRGNTSERPGGAAALQLISIRDELFPAYAASADFIQTYVFPGGMLIGEAEFRAEAERVGLRWQAREGYGPHYAETLRLWRERFDAAAREGRLPAGFDERFRRLWRYYLQYCEGGFRGGGIDVAQVVLRR